MRAVAFVPVRLTSSRLPRKHFKAIGDKTLFSWVVKRLHDCRELDDVVICAPDEPESKELGPACRKEGVLLYIYNGDVNDVGGGLVGASGDCLLQGVVKVEVCCDNSCKRGI